MSGLEVVGVVLGVLPLLVEGLKTVSPQRNARLVQLLRSVVSKRSQHGLPHGQI